jgi:hypothetical protein
MSTFELETAKIAVAYTHSPHLPKDKPVPCCIMLLTEPGCNKPSICIASVLPWSWTRGDRPLEREKHWKTIVAETCRKDQKGWFPALSASTVLQISWNLCLVHPCSVLFCNPNWASRTYNFEMVSTCVNYQLPEYENWPLPEQPKHDANTLTWKVSLLSWLELIIYLEWYIYMYIYYITVCICVYIK